MLRQLQDTLFEITAVSQENRTVSADRDLFSPTSTHSGRIRVRVKILLVPRKVPLPVSPNSQASDTIIHDEGNLHFSGVDYHGIVPSTGPINDDVTAMLWWRELLRVKVKCGRLRRRT